MAALYFTAGFNVFLETVWNQYLSYKVCISDGDIATISWQTVRSNELNLLYFIA